MKKHICISCAKLLRHRFTRDEVGDWHHSCYRREHNAPRVDTRKGYNG